MAVYCKFKSAKDYYSIPIKGQFVSVSSLKEAILKSNRYGKGKDFDLMISNGQTDEGQKLQRKNRLIFHPLVALAWQLVTVLQCRGNCYGYARRFPGWNGSMKAGFGFGHCGLQRRIPPAGYICHRCNLTGHFIKDCPTNGDPDYDKKKLKRPIGIPNSMLVETPDGPYTLPGGATVAMKPNESAFEKEVEGLSFTPCANDIPHDLRCPLCKEVMKDSVISGKCCFKSYCDKCIRAYIIAKSKCFCGATNMLADYLFPNITIRETISRILASGSSNAENSGSLVKVRDASKDGLEKSLLADRSGDVKKSESATHSLLTMKQPEKCPIDLAEKTKGMAMSMSAEAAASVKKVSGVEKKRRIKKRKIAEMTKGMAMGLSGYNEYNWADFLPIANERYMPSVMNPYVGQCYYYNQSNWDTTGLWMNGVSINQWFPPLVGKTDVKRNPDIRKNELYHKNRDKSCQRNRGTGQTASASDNVNDSLFKAMRVCLPAGVIDVLPYACVIVALLYILY